MVDDVIDDYPGGAVDETVTDQLLNVSQAAQLLTVHVNTVRNWADRGLLQSIRLPGSNYRRFEVAEIERVARLMRNDDDQPIAADGRRRRWPPIRGMSWYEPEDRSGTSARSAVRPSRSATRAC